MRNSLVISLSFLALMLAPALSAEVWNAYTDFSPDNQTSRNWSYVYHPGSAWNGFGSLAPMRKSTLYPGWWESPSTPYYWAPQVGLTAEWARICLTGCRLGGSSGEQPGLGILRWTAPSGGYYRIEGNGYIYPAYQTRLFSLTNRYPDRLLDVTVNAAFDERAYDTTVILNRGDTIAFGAEPLAGHGPYEFVGSYWTARVSRVPFVPEPWTPVEIDGRQLKCWGRVYDFGAGLLPASIKSGGVELLSGPVDLAAKVGGVAQVWGAASFTVDASEPDVALVTTSAESASLRAVCRVRFEFDGFVLIDLTVSPRSSSASITSMDIVIPFVQSGARLFHHNPVKPITEQNWRIDPMNCGAIPAGGMTLPFVHHIWIGTEKRGLQWFAESDRGLAPQGSFVNISPGRVMRLSLLGSRVVTTASPFRFVFGLMASPVKPMLPADAVRWAFPGGGVGIWNHDYYGNPVPPENSWLAELHRRGVNCLNLWNASTLGDPVVTNPDLPNLLNAASGYGIFVLSSTGVWADQSTPGFDPNTWPLKPVLTFQDETVHPGQLAYAMCHKGPWHDWFMDRAERAFREYNLDGVYLDGSVLPQMCRNQAHGCGYTSGSTEKYTCPILAAREYMKQLYLLSRSGGKKRLLLGHTSSSVFLPVLSFADASLDGEHVNSYPETNQPLNIDGNGVDHTNPTYTLEGFRAQMIGHQFGIPAFYLKYARPGYVQEDVTRCSAYALAHGMMPLSLDHAPFAWKVYREFGAAQAQWIPYWEDNRPVTTASDLKISTYVKHGEGALAVVANLTTSEITAQLAVNRAIMGLNAEATVWDLQSQSSLSIDPDTAEITVAPGNYRWIRIGHRDPGTVNLITAPLHGSGVAYSCSTAADSSRGAQYAADGNLYTGWQSAIEAWPTAPTPRPPIAWWSVTWSVPQTFNTIRVSVPGESSVAPEEFVLESRDGASSAWNVVSRVRKTGNAQTFVIYLPAPVTASELRYRVLNTTGFSYGPYTTGALREIEVYNRDPSGWATVEGVVRDSRGSPVSGACTFIHIPGAFGDVPSFENTHIIGSLTGESGQYAVRIDPAEYPNAGGVSVHANGISIGSSSPHTNVVFTPTVISAGQTSSCDVTLPGPTDACLQLGGAQAGPWLRQALNIPGSIWETASAVVAGRPCAEVQGLSVLFWLERAFASGRFQRMYVDVDYFDDGISGMRLLAPPVPENFVGSYYVPGPSMIRKENTRTWRSQTLVYENSLLTDWWAYGGDTAMFGLEMFEDGSAHHYDYVDCLARVCVRFAPRPFEGVPYIVFGGAGSPGDHPALRFSDHGLHARLVPCLLGENPGTVVDSYGGTGVAAYVTSGRSSLVLDVDNNYAFGPVDALTLKIDYFDGTVPSTPFTVAAIMADGSVSSRRVVRTGSGSWRTAVLTFTGVMLRDGFYGCGDIIIDDGGTDLALAAASVLPYQLPLSVQGIAEARTQPDLTHVSLPPMIVSAVFAGCFYMESPDRSAGIRVISDAAVEVGSVVEVSGWLVTSAGEREIHASAVQRR